MGGPGVLELADKLWNGELPIERHHPLFYSAELVEVADRSAFVPAFANVTAFATEEGLLLVDTSSALFAEHVVGQIRSWNDVPVRSAVYTHGHIDHVFGIAAFDAEAASAGRPLPEVIAHAAVARRFDRYRLTAGYNAIVNRRQFQIPDLQWPTEYRYPDRTYDDALTIEIGGESFELHHAKGETDDHTWVWVPARKVLCCGDLFIWASPNCGNPQKAQRYVREWADALTHMAGLDAEVLLPGHGYPVIGGARIREALTDTADLLTSLHEQTVDLINSGATLDEVIHTVRAPDWLLAKPYLRPIYDEPEFVVRNLWRLYAGWYDGDPARLKPAPEAQVAAELASLAGGAHVLAERAAALARDGELRLACHLAQLAATAAPEDESVRALHTDVFEQRAAGETSTMAIGIFRSAAKDASGAAT